MRRAVVCAGIASALALTACQSADQSAPADDNKQAVKADTTPLNAPQRAYSEANARMHAGMGIIDEDADIAFIQGMIPHHQGAVDMANIVLEHGDDEDAKKLARDIITAQEVEIAWMKNWLKERGLSEVDPAAVDHSAMGH